MYVRHRTKFLLLEYWIFTVKNEFFSVKNLKFIKMDLQIYIKKLETKLSKKTIRNRNTQKRNHR